MAAAWTALSVLFLGAIPIVMGQAAGSAATVKYGKPQPGNVQGDLMVLDAGSLSFRGNHPVFPGVSTPAQCSDACARLPGCNAWNFCNSTGAGCGSGCRAYVAQHPPIKSNFSVPGGLALSDRKLPVLGFGPWPQPYGGSGCQWTYSPSTGEGSSTDAWGFGTCSLKRLQDPSKPTYYSSSAGEGWVSGTITLPAACSSVSARACLDCLAAKNPGECLACAKDPRAAADPLGAVQSGSQTQRACAQCANVTSRMHRKRCIDCVLGNQPCGYCVTGAYRYGSPNITACLDCVSARGAAARGACSACSQLGPKSSRCFSCLSSFPLKFCPEGQAPAAQLPDGCVRQEVQTPCDQCGSAAKSGAAYDQCLGCFKSVDPGGREECMSCTWFTDLNATAQARCFACALRANVTGQYASGCGMCLAATWVPETSRERCMACVEDRKTPMAAKGTCAYCLQAGRSAGKSNSCLGCLQTKQTAGDYQNTCARD